MKKYIQTALLFVFLLLLCNASIPINNLEEKDDRDKKTILKNLTAVPYRGVPGDLLVFGTNASVVLTNSGKIPVIAVSHFGKGKALAFTHSSLFSNEVISTKEGGLLVTNVIQLKNSSPGSILCVGLPDLAKHLKKSYKNVLYTDKLPRKVSGYDIIFIDIPYGNDPAFRDKQVARLQNFVYNGGILAAAAIGWVFINYGEGKEGKTLDEFYGNKLFAPFGISWGNRYATDRNEQYLVSESAGGEAHFLHVINRALSDINAGTVPDDFQKSREELNMLSSTLDQVPVIDYLLSKNQVEAIMKKFGDLAEEIIPAEDNPIHYTDIEASYLITFVNAILKKSGGQYTQPGIAGDFPGNPGSGPAVTKELEIDTAIPLWHSTGLYAPPGAELTVLLPRDAITSGLGVQIGCHTDTLYHHDSWKRWPDLITAGSLTQTATTISNPHGGLVYIKVPVMEKTNKIKITIKGAMEAPYFKLGETTAAEWKKILAGTKAPWGEIESANIIITVPVESLQKLSDPSKVLRWWDKVVEAIYDLAQKRGRTGPERFVCDRQISAGYMHSGYPVMTHLDVQDFVIGLEDGKLFKEGSWGHFHELGHNNQNYDWTFEGTGEVTVNLFTLYAMEKVVGIPPSQHPMLQDTYKRAKAYLEKGSPFDEWKKDPFLALIMYVQLQNEFGWAPFQHVFAKYLALAQEEHPKNDQEKRDMWMVSFSNEIGINLGPFFKMWGIPVSQNALDSIKRLPRWMPDPL